MKSAYLLCIALAGSSAHASGQPFAEDDVVVIRTYDGLTPGEQLGAIVNKLGDFNNDGEREWGACGIYCSVGFPNAGRVIIVDGKSGDIVREHFGPFQSAELTGPFPTPDIDGDGIEEYTVVTSPNAPTSGAWVYSGDLSIPQDEALLYHQTGAADEIFSFGNDMGDINGDGIGDLGWSSEEGVSANGATGWVKIVSGADPTQVLREHIGDAPGDRFGNMIGKLDDVNNDGVTDYWIGIPQSSPPATRGLARLYSGADGSVIHEFRGNQRFGAVFSLFYLYPADDVNNDGVRELFVPDTGDYTRGLETGRVFLFDPVSGEPIWQRVGASGDEGFGIGSEMAIDYTGDGIHDHLICSYLSSDGAPAAGKAQLFDGTDGTLLRTITGTIPGENMGVDSAGAGDVNGDGIKDFIVASWFNDAAGQDAGRLWLIAGQYHGEGCSYADLAEPYGKLNYFDVTAFLIAYLQHQPVADLTDDRIVNAHDVLAYLSWYADGCDP